MKYYKIIIWNLSEFYSTCPLGQGWSVEIKIYYNNYLRILEEY
jgi:hypothetical protein